MLCKLETIVSWIGVDEHCVLNIALPNFTKPYVERIDLQRRPRSLRQVISFLPNRNYPQRGNLAQVSIFGGQSPRIPHHGVIMVLACSLHRTEGGVPTAWGKLTELRDPQKPLLPAVVVERTGETSKRDLGFVKKY